MHRVVLAQRRILATMKPPITFSLQDAQDNTRTFPPANPVLLAFVKADCETCNLTLPILEALHCSIGTQLTVWALVQARSDIPTLRARHSLTIALLDDDALNVSADADIDTVPSLFLYDRNGTPIAETYGFDRKAWRDLIERAESLVADGDSNYATAIDWDTLPPNQPGCGARNVEPGIAEKIAARRTGGFFARRLEIAAGDDIHEFLFAQGFTDGLPVVPPTPERVERMLTGTKRDRADVVAVVPPNLAACTVEKAAINAVMAGAKPEDLPVILTAIEAACTNEFNIHGVLATTWLAGPIVIVNGPVRHRLGMNMQGNALGQGNRANAAIGRALQLVVRNIGGGRPGEVDRATLGGPHKYTCCFAEYEERSPWEPLHVERGFQPEDSTVTLFAGSGPQPIADQLSRSAQPLVTSIALGLESLWHPKVHNFGETFLVISPEHVDTIAASGWSKDDIRRHIQETTARPLRELIRGGDTEEGMPVPTDPAKLDERVPKFRSAKEINIVVAGSEAGKFSHILGNWVSGPIGSISVTRKISD